MSTSHSNGKQLRWAFCGTAAAVVAIYFARDFTPLPGATFVPEKLAVGVYALLGLLALHLVLFTITLFIALLKALAVLKRDIPESEKQQETEDVLAPAMRGEADPPARLLQYSEIPLGICGGLIAGCILAWIVTGLLRWAGRFL